MKFSRALIVYVLTTFLVVAPVRAFEVKGNTIEMTNEETEQCKAGGGCALAPVEALETFMRRMGQEGFDEGMKQGLRDGYKEGFEAGLAAAVKRKVNL